MNVSNGKDSLSYFKCTHPNVRKAAVFPLSFLKERGKHRRLLRELSRTMRGGESGIKIRHYFILIT
jgi:hypothetical protein